MLRLEVQVRNRSHETARLAAIAVLAPYGAVFANGQGTKVSYAESELIKPGKLVRKGLRLVAAESIDPHAVCAATPVDTGVSIPSMRAHPEPVA